MIIKGIEPATEAAVRRFAALIAEKYSVAGVILYGSPARGDHHDESDVDVAVLLNGERMRYLDTKLDMCDVACDVMLESEECNLRISPLPVWMDEWNDKESYSNPELLKNIEKDGIRL